METPQYPPLFSERFAKSAFISNRDQDTVTHFSAISIGLGVAAILLGVFALFHFVAMSLISMYVLGTIFILSAIIYGVHMFMAKRWNFAVIDLVAAILFAVAGIFVLRQPISALGAVTIVIGCFYLVNGIIRTVGSLTMQPMHWGWMLVDGMLSTIVGGLILASWPSSAFWLIGFILGLDLILSGSSMISVGMVAHKRHKTPRRNINMSQPAIS